MASVAYDNTVRIWNLDEMRVVNVIEDKTSKREFDYKINTLAW
jgi:WD40 repeat protein